MNDDSYRTRVYEYYLTARSVARVPESLDVFNPRAAYLRRLVRDHFPPGRDIKVLDVGCGHGALLHFAREAGYKNINGIDGSPEQVGAAQKLGVPGVTEGDLLEALASRADGTLDVVVAFDVVEHLKRDELLCLVDEVHRVLKPGGRWIIHVPNGESPFFGAIRYGDLTHEIAFTRASLSQIVLSSGFSRLDCFEDAPVVHGVKSAIRRVLWNCFRSMLRLYVAAETGDASRVHVFSRNMLAVATK